MEGRCAVETLSELGEFISASVTPEVILSSTGAHVFTCTGGDEVHVFSVQEGKVTSILQFPAAVTDVLHSHERQMLLAACSTGVYALESHLLSPRIEPSPSDGYSGPPVLKVSPDSSVLTGHGLTSLLLVGSLLLTLSQSDSSWLLTVHSAPCLETPGGCEALGCFSLPLLTPSLQPGADARTQHTHRPVLVCVHPGDRVPPSSPAASALRRLHVEPLLFKLLFGADAALSRSPVALCGLPDGRLCCLPLRLPGARIRVLHSLEQPVVFVGAAAARGQQSLVAVGGRGRVVLMRADRGSVETGVSIAGVTQGCVSGSVRCGFVDQNCLLYSTGSDLLKLSLSDESPGAADGGREKEAAEGRAAVLQSPVSLNVSRVIAMDLFRSEESGSPVLVGLSDRGKLLRVSLPAGRTEEAEASPSHVGRSVRDLLSAIGDVCERASALKTLIKSKKQLLRRLNEAVNVALLLRAEPVEDRPIRCEAATRWTRSLLNDSLSLLCVLENRSVYALERGWALSLSVSVSSEDASTSTFVFPVSNLSPGGRLEVCVPVSAAADEHLPVNMSCALVFSLRSVLQEEEELQRSLPDSHRGLFMFPLNTLTVDWLHVLQPVDANAPGRPVPQSSLQAFITSHRTKGGVGADRGRETPEECSARVRVSADSLRAVLKPKSSESAPLDPPASFLAWLLFESHEGVKPERGEAGNESGSELHARTPGGAAVRLTAKQVEREIPGAAEKQAGMEVRVESSSLAAVSGLHHALLLRVQTLLQGVPEPPASAGRVQSSRLRSALQRSEVQRSRVLDAVGASTPSAQTDSALLSVYRDLRADPFFFF